MSPAKLSHFFGNENDGGPTVDPPAKMPDFWRSNLNSDENVAENNASSLHTKHLVDEFVGDHDVLGHVNELNISSKATISKYKKPSCLDDEDIKSSSQSTNRENESALFNTQVDALNMDSLKFCRSEQPVLPVEEHSAGEDNMNFAVSSLLSSSAPNSLTSDDTGIYRPVESSLLKHESSEQGTDNVRSSDEKAIIKKRPSRNINVQNFWLYIFGMIFNIIAILVQDFSAVVNKLVYHSVNDVAILRFMVEVCWGPMLAAFSMTLDQSIDCEWERSSRPLV